MKGGELKMEKYVMDNAVLTILGEMHSEFGPNYKDYIDRFEFKFMDETEKRELALKLTNSVYHDMIKLEVLLHQLGLKGEA